MSLGLDDNGKNKIIKIINKIIILDDIETPLIKPNYSLIRIHMCLLNYYNIMALNLNII